MKRLITIGVLVVVAAAAGITYVVLKNRPPPEYDGSDSVYRKVKILDFERDKIKRIELTSERGSLTLRRDEDDWKPDYPYPVLLDDMDVADVAATFSKLWGEDLVAEDPEDLSVYGLDEPIATGTAYLDDDSTVVLHLGDRTPVGNTFYLMVEGDPKVYTVWMSHAKYLQYVVQDIRFRRLPAPTTMEISYLKFVRAGRTELEIIHRDRGDLTPEEELYLFTSGSWQMVEPYDQKMAVDLKELQTLLESIGQFEIKAFIDDNPDLAAYGLDPPKAEVVVRDQLNEFHFLLGDAADDNTAYAMMPESPTVFTMEKRLFNFMAVEAFKLVDKFVFITLIDEIDRIEVSSAGARYTVELKRSQQQTKDGELETVTTFLLNNQEVEEDAFRTFYRDLIGVFVDAEVDREVKETPEVSTSFYLSPKDAQEHFRVDIDYIPYDRNFYAVSRDGVTEFVVARESVQRMLKKLEALRNATQ